MRVLLVHNEYETIGGEEFIAAAIREILESHGHATFEYRRRTRELESGMLGSARAFVSGIHSGQACRDVKQILESFRPDVVHIQNLFPLISPSIVPMCRKAGVPVVMNIQNFRLACPNGLHYSHGEICTRCLGGKEYWCVLRNCEHSLLKSAGYALRNAVARLRGAFTKNVSIFTPPTLFHARWLADQGIEPDRIHVIPNMVDDVSGGDLPAGGAYVGFAGRVSPEKGVDVLLDAARRLPSVPFRIAGSFERMPALPASAPPNVRFLGQLGPQELSDFYANARMVVVPSVWFEGFPTVIPQAMLRARPVIASDVGGLRDVIDDGITGFLFPMGDSAQLADRIRSVWADPALAESIGVSARQKAVREYSRERYYERLIEAFAAARALRATTVGAQPSCT